ncbi:MAG: alkaline phosphatase family protein, partial [Acidobacteria bacterium]|nr:alkaline phosphatase family protein [Acidobacteriota bacterium]
MLVFIVSEQFRSEYLERAEPFLVAGGFRRLMNEGAFYPNCYYFSSAFTASGLATLATGTYPESHGIIADVWFDRSRQSIVKAGGETLESTTFAGQIEAGPRDRIFAVGMGRGNLEFLAGRAPTLTFYMQPDGQFAAAPAEPAWWQAFQRAHALEELHDARWLAIGAAPGAAPLRVLKYSSATPAEFAALYKASPFAQNAQFDLIRDLITHEKLGQGETTDYLFVTLDSMALLGYETGSDSPLMQQMVLHMDRQLALVLDTLKESVGAGNYDLVFTAAHGAPPERGHGTKIRGEQVAQAVNQALAAELDLSNRMKQYVERYVYPFLYLRLDELRRYEVNLRQVRESAGRAALRVPGVAGYFTADGDSSFHGGWINRFRNSFHAVRSGDVMLSYLPEYVEYYNGGQGISYGSVYNYDCRVPLFLYGAQFRARVFETSVQAVDVAP